MTDVNHRRTNKKPVNQRHGAMRNYHNSMPVADFAFYKTNGGKDILYISYTINKDATNFTHANQVRSLKVVHKEIVII